MSDPAPRSLDVLPVGEPSPPRRLVRTTSMTNIPRPTASLTMAYQAPMKANELKTFLANVPDEATVTISSYSGDQRDNTPGGYNVTAKWQV